MRRKIYGRHQAGNSGTMKSNGRKLSDQTRRPNNNNNVEEANNNLGFDLFLSYYPLRVLSTLFPLVYLSVSAPVVGIFTLGTCAKCQIHRNQEEKRIPVGRAVKPLSLSRLSNDPAAAVGKRRRRQEKHTPNGAPRFLSLRDDRKKRRK